MSLSIPDWLRSVGNMIGEDFPEGDEDKVWAQAQRWKHFADELEKQKSAIDDATRNTLDGFAHGQAHDAMAAEFRTLTSGDASLDVLIKQLRDLSDAVDKTGTEIEFAKEMYIANLAILAATLAALAASVWINWGAPAEGAVAVAVTEGIITQIIRAAIAKVVEAGASKVISQLVLRALQGAMINAAMSGGLNALVQADQMLKGHRKEFDLGSLGRDAASGAISGAVAGPLMHGAKAIDAGSALANRAKTFGASFLGNTGGTLASQQIMTGHMDLADAAVSGAVNSTMDAAHPSAARGPHEASDPPTVAATDPTTPHHDGAPATPTGATPEPVGAGPEATPADHTNTTSSSAAPPNVDVPLNLGTSEPHHSPATTGHTEATQSATSTGAGPGARGGDNAAAAPVARTESPTLPTSNSPPGSRTENSTTTGPRAGLPSPAAQHDGASAAPTARTSDNTVHRAAAPMSDTHPTVTTAEHASDRHTTPGSHTTEHDRTTAQSARDAEPGKGAESGRISESGRGLDLGRGTEPGGGAEPGRGAEPVRSGEPGRASDPPSRAGEPGRSAESGRGVEPARRVAAEPNRGAEPGYRADANGGGLPEPGRAAERGRPAGMGVAGHDFGRTEVFAAEHAANGWQGVAHHEDPAHARTVEERYDSHPSGLSADQREAILALDKGDRPDPAEYLSPHFIESHLASFRDGATRFMPASNVDRYGIAQTDGTSFMMTRHDADALLHEAHGDLRAMERALGLPLGFLDDNTLVRIDVANPTNYGLRIPSGNEAGANSDWIPGGFLPDGLPEAVIDGRDVPAGGYTRTEIDQDNAGHVRPAELFDHLLDSNEGPGEPVTAPAATPPAGTPEATSHPNPHPGDHPDAASLVPRAPHIPTTEGWTVPQEDAPSVPNPPDSAPRNIDPPFTTYTPEAPQAALSLNDAFTAGYPTTNLAQQVADYSTHHVSAPVGGDSALANRVVLGKWDGQDGGYIGEARHHGGIYFDTGGETWAAIENGLSPEQAQSVGWQVNEQFLRTQMERHVGRIDYLLDREKYSTLEEMAIDRAGSFSSMEVEFLIDNAESYGYQRIADSWIYTGGE